MLSKIAYLIFSLNIYSCFLFISEQVEIQNLNFQKASTPTGKGGSVFLTPEQGRAAKAVFGKIILAGLRYFPEKPCTV